MPFNFRLPTTSYLAFQDSLNSPTHPSLPLSATAQRGVLRNVLKSYKRLPLASQASHLNNVLSALNDYLPYLLALDCGISGRPVSDEEIEVSLIKEVDTEWRAYLTSAMPGREAGRVKLHSFEYEILFVLLTMGETYYLLARSQLHSLYAAVLPTSEQRVSLIQTALKHFLSANSVLAYGHARASQLEGEPSVADIASSTFGALAALCLAEANLTGVLKDDPYPAAVVQDRNKNDKEWMFKAPDIPKVRARLFATICLGAGDHAAKGIALLGRSSKIDEKLLKYLEDVRRAARGKACRFLGIDADLAGDTGEAIAWLNGARKELGFLNVGVEEEKKSRGFGRLKKDWIERREDKKIEKGGDWGSDGGRYEEGRVVDMLKAKWEKMNSTVNVQVVPPSESLLSKLPSGRDITAPIPWVGMNLDAATLAQMRAPPDPEAERYRPDDNDSDEEESGGGAGGPAGAFPGTASEYSSGNAYY